MPELSSQPDVLFSRQFFMSRPERKVIISRHFGNSIRSIWKSKRALDRIIAYIQSDSHRENTSQIYKLAAVFTKLLLTSKLCGVACKEHAISRLILNTLEWRAPTSRLVLVDHATMATNQ